ncbi:MAG: MFS transporter [Firmicutes bacterium]|nr:MFS transporter [Bacillota bacterium]
MTLNTLYKWIFVISALFIPMALPFTPKILGAGFLAPFVLLNIFAVPIAIMVTQLSIFVITSIQKETPNELLGKVLATITAVAQSAAPLGQLLYGRLFEVLKNAIYIPMLIIGVIVSLVGTVGKGFKIGSS